MQYLNYANKIYSNISDVCFGMDGMDDQKSLEKWSRNTQKHKHSNNTMTAIFTVGGTVFCHSRQLPCSFLMGQSRASEGPVMETWGGKNQWLLL